MKVALITGITGQDGSYLSELLLEKDYIVYGLIRRSSSINTKRIDHLYHHINLKLRYGDLSDSSNLLQIFYEIKNTYEKDLDRLEVYNLGAMSHVKVSFEMPEYTGEVDGLGTLKLLEAIKNSGLQEKTRFYQASTSELFGKVVEIPQKETTPFYPRSPYGVAKLYSYWIVKNYRESYNMFACNGILFNHETLAGFTPVIIKKNNIIDIKPISEVVKYDTLKNKTLINEKKNIYQDGIVEEELYIWDNNDWTKVKYASGYPHEMDYNNKNPKFIISKNSAFLTTSKHKIIMDNNEEKECENIKIDDKIKLVHYPSLDIKEYQHSFFKKDDKNDLECIYCNKILSRQDHYNNHIKKCCLKNDFYNNKITKEESLFLGLMVGDGSFHKTYKFTNKNIDLIHKVIDLWKKICEYNQKKCNYNIQKINSGFKKDSIIYQVILTGFNDFLRKYQIYNEDGTKRIPFQILNESVEIQKIFLDGYNYADGLKSNKCIYEYKNFKTNSATLAQGLLFLIHRTTKQNFNINVEYVEKFNKKRLYYSINLLSNTKFSLDKSIEKVETIHKLHNEGFSQRKINKITGISRSFQKKVIKNNYDGNAKHHKCKENNVVKKIINMDDYNGWFYDLETESGTFHAGIGLGFMHNSPRRGETFVTRKVTRGLSKILKGEMDTLVMGNIDSKRDWGHAKDYVEGMWRILQHDKPDDFVLSTNRMYSVREFIEKSFALKGFNIRWEGEGINEKGYDKESGKLLIEISDKYFRPAEVDLLLGDSTKARTELGWKPEYSFDELVKEMVEYDCSN